ncbi:hypothetical protein [Nostoc sp. JL33]|uniref:hypothetical protein n=1 Tax=Nostoc sp. JL33 TaxID=2815396 RepID=UPI0025D9050A|nr:hypothetical protein [Nostoc sp. JL33]MBN3869979.1 hypothetical protein [Nostoc sp. JL33]
MNDSETLFTDLTLNEESSLSGGKKSPKTEKPHKLAKKKNIYSNGKIIGVSYSTVSGSSVVFGNLGDVRGVSADNITVISDVVISVND